MNENHRALVAPTIGRPAGPIIDRIDDPRLADVLALTERSVRDRTGSFLIEGLRFVHFALEKSLPIDTLVYCPTDLKHPLARSIVADLIGHGVPSIVTTSSVLLSIASREDPQGLVAVTRQFTQPLVMSTPSSGLCWIAVDTIQSPGNLGTLMRTADCVGAAGIILIGDNVDPWYGMTLSSGDRSIPICFAYGGLLRRCINLVYAGRNRKRVDPSGAVQIYDHK